MDSNSEHPQEFHVGVAVRDDMPSRKALEWAIREFSTEENKPNLLFTLIHVVSDVTNTRMFLIPMFFVEFQVF